MVSGVFASSVLLGYERGKIGGCDMLFIAAGMGGGTGTGAAPAIAEMAKRLGILTVAVVTTPFYFEGKKRMENAMGGIARLRKNVDSIIISMSWI